MRGVWIGAALAVSFVSPSSAQQLAPEDQLAPSQMRQPMPAAVAAPTAVPGHGAVHSAPRATAASKPANLHNVVACSGAFSKDSSNLKLAMLFQPQNVTFTTVDVQGTKVGASVLFEKDPKRRLEVWWSNPDRRDTYLIVINGKSTWSAPGGMRLGLTLAEVQKLNHKPFRLKGFDKDGTTSVSDWDGGALATLPGGCKFGISLQADPKASADDLAALPADKEFSSDDSAMRTVKPKVSEILIGY